MKRSYKYFSVLMSFVLLFSAFPVFGLVGNAAEIVAGGECGDQGDNVTWTLDDEGLLIISGSGEMKDYVEHHSTPWEKERVLSVKIEYGVSRIGVSAFSDCSNLSSVSIGDSVTEISIHAFLNCRNLKEIHFPNSFTFIDMEAFSGCTGLQKVVIPSAFINDGAFSGCTGLKSIIIGDGVRVLCPGLAFCSCFNLEAVSLGKGLTDLEDYNIGAFTHLTGITVDPDNSVYSSEDGILYNKDKTELLRYPGGRTTKSFIVPDSVNSIHYGAFLSDNLTEITIPSGVTSVGDYAFGYSQVTDPNDGRTRYEKMPGFLIHCYSDSAAYRYAVFNEIEYDLLDQPADDPSPDSDDASPVVLLFRNGIKLIRDIIQYLISLVRFFQTGKLS